MQVILGLKCPCRKIITKKIRYQNCSIDLLYEAQIRSDPFTGCDHFGLPASSTVQCLPMRSQAAPALGLGNFHTITAWVREAPTQDFHPHYISHPTGCSV